MNILEKAEEYFQYTRSIRRDLHAHPELGFEEFRTAQLIARQLKEVGYQVTEHIAGTGVVGILDSGKPGKTLMLRFDMDALPIVEQSDCDYISTTPGIMHACGHDGHVAIGLTLARIMAAEKDHLNGQLMLLFQPAEEGFGKDSGRTFGGAEAMIREGVLDQFHPDACAAVHLWNEQPTGMATVHAGPLMAGADLVTITVNGRGGHGALPHLSADPVVTAAQILVSLQTIISRNVPPLETVVLTIAEFHAGEAPNVIPAKAVLRGTMRTFTPEMRELLIQRIHKIAESVSAGMGCQTEVEILPIAPAVVNDAVIAQLVAKSANRHIPSLGINNQFKVMVSEDMAYFMNMIPGCYVLIGAGGGTGMKYEPHHNPSFSFDELGMRDGVALLAGFSLDYLSTRLE